MDVYVLLDVLLIILIALFIPIGFWRGAYREAFVTLGILFGAAVGWFWGETWGIELAAITRLHESGGAFMVAMLALISATFLLGYSAGAALPVPHPGWIARSLGALIAGANGALLLSFALRDIRVYLLSAEDVGFLDNAVIAPFLSEGTGWILLVSAAVFVPIALVLALFGTDVIEEEDDYYETDEYGAYGDERYYQYAEQTIPTRPRAVEDSPRPRRARPEPAEETRPIPAMDASEPRSPHGVQQAFGAHAVGEPAGEAHHSGDVNQTPDAVDTSVQGREPQPVHQDERVPPDSSEPEQASEPQRADNQQHMVETPAPNESTDEHDVPQEDETEFGSSNVEESTREREVVFGFRHGQEMSHGICPNCHAEVSAVEGYCRECGNRI